MADNREAEAIDLLAHAAVAAMYQRAHWTVIEEFLLPGAPGVSEAHAASITTRARELLKPIPRPDTHTEVQAALEYLHTLEGATE